MGLRNKSKLEGVRAVGAQVSGTENLISPSTILAICLLLVAITWFVFGQTIRFPFVNFDDPEYVYEVPEINHGLTPHGIVWAFTHFPSPNWYPLTNISHMLEFQVFGMNAGGYHFTNVLLHTIAVLLLFLVLSKITAVAGIGNAGRDQRSRLQPGHVWQSAFVAAIFAIHPLRVESVAWVIERKDVLSGVFFMLTLGAYAWYVRKRSLARYMVMSILFGCGLMSKPMLVTTPIVLLLLDYWPLSRIRIGGMAYVPSQEIGRDGARPSTNVSSGQGIFEKIPLFMLSLAVALITSSGIANARGAEAPLPFVWRISNAFVSYVVYIWQMLWPANLAVWYPHRGNHVPLGQVVFSIVFLIAVTLFAVRLRKSRPYFFVGWFWYLSMLAPVIGVIQVNLQGHADRYTYLPQIGLYLAIAFAIADLSMRWRFRRAFLTAAALLVIMAFAWTARAQTAFWRDSESLWTHAIAVTKDNALAHASLADLLLRRGRLDEAIFHCEEALKIRPADADAHNNLGLALLQKGDEKAAAVQFEKCLEIDADHMNAMVNLAWILATSQDTSTRDGLKAVELAEKVHQRAGHANAIVLRTLAAAYAETGHFSEAIESAEEAAELAAAQGNVGLADDLRRNVADYRMHRPLRSR
ncbi:MAG: tetratricopeptide repeat protein [Verrucomicrobiota bacterium]